MATWCNARYTLTAFSTWACEAWRTSDLMIQNGKWNNKHAELRMWKFNTVTQTSTKSSILYQFEGTVDTQLVRMASIHTNKNVRIVHMNIKKLVHRYWDTGCMCRYINIIYDIYIQICNGDLWWFMYVPGPKAPWLWSNTTPFSCRVVVVWCLLCPSCMRSKVSITLKDIQHNGTQHPGDGLPNANCHTPRRRKVGRSTIFTPWKRITNGSTST